MAGRQTGTDPKGPAPGAADYAREAASEWGRAIRMTTGNARARWRSLLASGDGKGGRIGDVADKALSKFGRVGSVAAKAGVGSRVVERVRPDESDDSSSARDESDSGTDPIPIQESVDVAAPLKVAYRCATTFQDYPAFIDRVKSAEADDSGALELVVTARGADRRFSLQIERVVPNERVDWRCEEEMPHLGTVTFHELAPKLTHIEISIDRKPSGLIEQLNRRIHLTDRALRADLQRFKAYAELWEDEEGAEAEAGTEEEDEELGGEELDDQESDSEEQEEAEAEPEPAGVD